jgi:hypothetical protein
MKRASIEPTTVALAQANVVLSLEVGFGIRRAWDRLRRQDRPPLVGIRGTADLEPACVGAVVSLS